MRFTFTIAVAAVTLMRAQAPSAVIRAMDPQLHKASSNNQPVAAPAIPLAGLPVAGYVLGPGPLDLRTLILTSKTPRLGDAVAAPENARRLFLPPRQQYALLEQNSDAPVALWPLHRAAVSATQQEAIPLTGALAHPDVVVFSPRGDAALLYSAAANKMQVVSNLPNQPSVGKDLSIPGTVTQNLVALTDDASLVVFWSPESASLRFSSKESAWQSFDVGVTPSALAFVPNSHDLAISDTARHTILLLPELNNGAGIPRILAAATTADHLAFTKSGEWLLAADFAHKQLSAIEIKTGTVTRAQGITQMDTMNTLRNGFTFLLSTNPGLSLLQVVAPAVSAEGTPNAIAQAGSSRLATIDVVSNGK
jgi:uncharacterized membrane protein